MEESKVGCRKGGGRGRSDWRWKKNHRYPKKRDRMDRALLQTNLRHLHGKEIKLRWGTRQHLHGERLDDQDNRRPRKTRIFFGKTTKRLCVPNLNINDRALLGQIILYDLSLGNSLISYNLANKLKKSSSGRRKKKIGGHINSQKHLNCRLMFQCNFKQKKHKKIVSACQILTQTKLPDVTIETKPLTFGINWRANAV